jgi:hypothetical protein
LISRIPSGIFAAPSIANFKTKNFHI